MSTRNTDSGKSEVDRNLTATSLAILLLIAPRKGQTGCGKSQDSSSEGSEPPAPFIRSRQTLVELTPHSFVDRDPDSFPGRSQSTIRVLARRRP